MRYLVIARDYECNDYEILLSGSDKIISEFTTKKNDSKEIRACFIKKVNDFSKKYNDNGDIVIIDDTNKKRIKVLYKKDIVVFKKIILNQPFILSTFKSSIYKIYSDADRVDIKSFRGKMYESYIKKSFKSKSSREDYYDIVRKILSLYKEYIKDKRYLDSPDDIYINYLKEKTKNLKQTKEVIRSTVLNESKQIDYSDFYLEVLSLYQSGGMAEVLALYSLDELYRNLTEEELESIQLVRTK